MRAKFSSNLGVFFATLGSAVGLGNIWKFPTLTGSNGGAAFLLIYILATLLVGLPLLIAETTLGRAARANVVTTFERLAPRKQPWWPIVGWIALAGSLCITAFYSEVAGWVYAYIFKAATNQITTTDPQRAAEIFDQLVSDPMASLCWQWLALIVTCTVVMLGVNKGIEVVTSRLMPLLLLLLLLLCVRSLTLPGVWAGLNFLFEPDFSKITPLVVLIALGLAFFKLAIGVGEMFTYGSYFQDDQNIPKTALRVMLADLSVSILAGIAIFPAVFSFGFSPEAGPALIFMSIPAVFAAMPGGTVFMVIFFLLTAMAGLGAMLGLFEVPVSIFTERYGLSRKVASLLTLLILVIIGMPAALSQSITADFKVFGLNPFEFFDFISSNILLPLGGIMTCIFVGCVYGLPALRKQLSNNGTLSNTRLIHALFFVIRYISPFLITIVLLHGLKLI